MTTFHSLFPADNHVGWLLASIQSCKCIFKQRSHWQGLINMFLNKQDELIIDADKERYCEGLYVRH